MARYHARIVGLLLGLVMALSVLLSPAGVAHAEPGPRPTLTPVPPAPPAAQPAAAPAEEAEAAPAPTPRPAIVVVLTPIAPVQGVAPASEVEAGPAVGVTVPVRYQPGVEAAPAAANVAPLAMTDLLSYRALLVSLLAFAIVGICILARRRVARI